VDLFSIAMGSTQRLPNGNTFIGWGVGTDNDFPAITEVDSSGNVVWEMKFNNNASICYRTRKFNWEPCNNLLNPDLFKSDSITAISALLSWDSDSKISGYILEYKKCSDSIWNSIPTDENSFELLDLESNTCYNWRILSLCSFYGDTVYYQTQSFTTDLAVGTNSLLVSGMSINVFPNPVSKNLNVVISITKKELISVSMLNLAGIKLFEQSFFASEGKNNLNIDLNNFTSGAYTIVVESEAAIGRKKVVIY
ncbi:MAG: T9SS type A sorting domain-containing protein, partial [Chitinophagales bacterium]|nr:T9SS type A sorting domain-containing protein [Chitinophagales bacterium]